MPVALVNNWWSLVVRGIAAILLGLVAVMAPGIAVAGLVLLIAAYLFIDGLFALIGAVRAARANERWGALLLEGIAGLAAAAVTFFWPGITTIALLYVAAAWALLTGVFEIAAAVRLRKHISGEWMLALAGIASIAFGVLLFWAPVAGVLALALWFGVYALFFGVLMIVLGLRLRSWQHSTTTRGSYMHHDPMVPHGA